MRPSFVILRHKVTGETTEAWPVDAAEIMRISDEYEVVEKHHFRMPLPEPKFDSPAPEPVVELPPVIERPDLPVVEAKTEAVETPKEEKPVIAKAKPGPKPKAK